MVHVGLDLSRTRLDVCVLGANGDKLTVTTSPPDRDGLGVLARKIAGFGEPVSAAIESMNGARYIHDTLELLGWDAEIADAQKVKGLAPLACKTDRIDAWVLASCRGANSCPRSGCRIPRSARSANGPAIASIWCATEPCSRTGSTPP